MDLQTMAVAVIGLLALFTAFYFGYTWLVKTPESTTSVSRVTSSCFRYVTPAAPLDIFYKVGLLVRVDRPITKSDVLRMSVRLSSGSSEAKPPVLEVTKPMTGTPSFVNIAFTLKKTVVGPDLPMHTSPGSLAFTFEIEISGMPVVSFPGVPVEPIDVDPC